MTDTHWDAHPAVPSGDDRTSGDRAADWVRNALGSWRFVIAFLAGMVCWSFLQLLIPFDPYPFILLNLLLSTLAGLQGAILLIAAKRADKISALVAIHTSDNTDTLVKLMEVNTQLTELVERMTTEVHQHVVHERKHH